MADNESSGGLEELITKKKIGKVPVWAFGIGMAAVFIVYLIWRNHLANAQPTEPAPEAQDPNAIDPNTGLPYGSETDSGYGLPGGSIGDYLSNDPTNPAYPVGSTAQGLPGPVTNVQWSRLAFDELLAKGDDPTLVGNALSKFLAGSPLTQAEQAIVDLAEQTFGAPPEGLIPVTPTGPPTSPTTPTKKNTATVSAGWKVNQWIRDVQAGKADGVANPTFSYSFLASHNPTVLTNLRFTGKNTENTTFIKSATYIVRS